MVAFLDGEKHQRPGPIQAIPVDGGDRTALPISERVREPGGWNQGLLEVTDTEFTVGDTVAPTAAAGEPPLGLGRRFRLSPGHCLDRDRRHPPGFRERLPPGREINGLQGRPPRPRLPG